MNRIITYLFLLCSITGLSQEGSNQKQSSSLENIQEIDSTLVRLEKELSQATSDTLTARIMFKLGVHLWDIDSFKSEQYFSNAAATLNNSSYGKTALLGDVYRYLAALFTDKGRYIEAMTYYNKAKELLETFKDSISISNVYHNISILHKYQGNTEEQKRNLKATIAINEKLNYPEGLGHDYKALGEYYSNLNIADSALFFFEKSKRNFSLIQDEFGLYSLKGIIADFYLKQGDYKKSIDLFKECLKYFDKKDVKGFQSIYASKIASAYVASNNYGNALAYNKKSLNIALEEDYKQWISSGYLQNSEIQELLRNYKLAYHSAKLHKQYSDSIFNKKNVKKIQELELTYQFRKEKVKDSLQLVKQKEIAEANTKLLKTENKIKTQWMLFGGLGLLALFSIIYLIRSRKFVASKQELQEQFSHDLISEQEKERARLARELHDSVGQKLMLLSKTTKTLGDAHAENLANSTLEEVRNISRGLHPSNLERLGLTEAINALIHDINANTDLFFTEEIEHIDNLLSKDFELHLFRIIQETLSNIVKHSEAKAVKITVNKTEQNITVMVSDNGKGFNFESKKHISSLGMKTLFERAKILNTKLNLQSDLGKGTVITLNIPI